MVPLFANTDTEHGGTQAPLPHTQGSVCPMVLPSACSPAPQRRGAQPLGAAAAAVHPPWAQRAAGCAWASSCTALPGGWGAQLTAPRTPRLQPLAQPLVCTGCWGPAAPPPHSRLSQDLALSPRGCWCRARTFPSCVPGCGVSALGSYLLLLLLWAGGGPHRTPAPLSCLPGAVLGAAHHLAPPRLWGRGETEPT